MNSFKKVYSSIPIIIGILFYSNMNLSSQVLDSLMSEEVGLEDLLNIEVLSASRSSQKSYDAPGSVIVITADKIKKSGYRTLTEVFEDVPGFDFTIKQPSGEVPTHFIFRGITDIGQTNLLIMVDGLIRNDISNGWARGMGFDFPLIDVERIELISGPGSALYGANAYAGLVNIITKKHDENYFEGRVSYGSNNTIAPEVIYNQHFENGLNIQLAGQLFYTDGDRGIDRYDPGNYFHNNYEPDSVLTTEYGNIYNERNPDGSRKKIPDGFNNSIKDYGIRGRINKDGLTLGFSYWNRFEGLASQAVGYEYFANSDDLDYIAHHSEKAIFFEYDTEFTDNLRSVSKLFYRNGTVAPETGFTYTFQYQSVDNGIDSAVSDKKKSYFSEGFLTRFEQQFNYQMSENNTIVFGFHLESQNKQFFGVSLGQIQDDNSTIVTSTYPNESSSVQPVYYTENIGLFVQDELILYDNYHITGGLRYDYDEDYGGTIIPRLAIVGSVIDDMYFKLLYAQAYKAPNFFQLYEEWRGNENLKPQRITTYEAELGYSLFDMLNVRANIYYSDLYDLLVVAENPDPTKVPIGPQGEHAEYYQNLGTKEIYGASLIGDLILSNDIMISANYSLTAGSDFEAVDNIAKHKINLAVNYRVMDYLNINLRANYLGEVKAPISNLYFYPKTEETISEVGYDYMVDDNPNGYLDEVLLLNLTLTGQNIELSGVNVEPQLIIRNLLDTDYYLVGTQEGSGARPVDELQPTIQNPNGFLPAYHPQAGMEIFFRLMVNF